MKTLEDRVRALEDTQAVSALMADYHDACDGWDERGTHRDPDQIAALFTEDGVWEVSSRSPSPAGRAQIAALARDLQKIPWIVHFVVNPQVWVEGDTATGRFKGIIRVRLQPDARLLWTLGRYDLQARRTAEGWCISRLAWAPFSTSERYTP